MSTRTPYNGGKGNKQLKRGGGFLRLSLATHERRSFVPDVKKCARDHPEVVKEITRLEELREEQLAAMDEARKEVARAMEALEKIKEQYRKTEAKIQEEMDYLYGEDGSSSDDE